MTLTTRDKEIDLSEGGQIIMKGPMWADIFAYMIYLEGPEYPEYVMHICYLKYSGAPKHGNMLRNCLRLDHAKETTENHLKYSGCPQQRKMLCVLFCIKCSIPKNTSGNNFQHGKHVISKPSGQYFVPIDRREAARIPTMLVGASKGQLVGVIS